PRCTEPWLMLFAHPTIPPSTDAPPPRRLVCERPDPSGGPTCPRFRRASCQSPRRSSQFGNRQHLGGAVTASPIPRPPFVTAPTMAWAPGTTSTRSNHDLLGRSLAAVAVESLHLHGVERHQLSCEGEVGGAASSGLLDMKRSP